VNDTRSAKPTDAGGQQPLAQPEGRRQPAARPLVGSLRTLDQLDQRLDLRFRQPPGRPAQRPDHPAGGCPVDHLRPDQLDDRSQRGDVLVGERHGVAHVRVAQRAPILARLRDGHPDQAGHLIAGVKSRCTEEQAIEVVRTGTTFGHGSPGSSRRQS
jgi:hypothetical protein